MATGFLTLGKCFDTAAQATDAHYGAYVPSVVSGSTSYTLEYVLQAGVWKAQQYQIGSNGVYTLRSTSNAPTLTFPSCDTTQQFFDGMALGWAIVAVMAVAWGARKVREQVR
jgi:hypothetical protein